MAADDRDGVLVDIDGDAGAELLAGEAALEGLPVALGEVGVADADLVNPDGVAHHDSVPAAGRRGERTVPPLEGGLVVDAAQIGRALDGDVVAHEPDEGDSGEERLSAVLEDGPGEGVESPAAAAAAPPRYSCCGGPVPSGALGAALRAPRVRPVCRGATASVPTPTSLRQCLSPTASLNSRNSSAVRPATSALKGFALSIWIFPIRPSAHPEGLSPNKDPGGRSGGFFVWLGRA